MTTVFADTVYWIATVRPNDPWAASANRARERVGAVRLITTDELCGVDERDTITWRIGGRGGRRGRGRRCQSNLAATPPLMAVDKASGPVSRFNHGAFPSPYLCVKPSEPNRRAVASIARPRARPRLGPTSARQKKPFAVTALAGLFSPAFQPFTAARLPAGHVRGATLGTHEGVRSSLSSQP